MQEGIRGTFPDAPPRVWVFLAGVVLARAQRNSERVSCCASDSLWLLGSRAGAGGWGVRGVRGTGNWCSSERGVSAPRVLAPGCRGVAAGWAAGRAGRGFRFKVSSGFSSGPTLILPGDSGRKDSPLLSARPPSPLRSLSMSGGKCHPTTGAPSDSQVCATGGLLTGGNCLLPPGMRPQLDRRHSGRPSTRVGWWAPPCKGAEPRAQGGGWPGVPGW